MAKAAGGSDQNITIGADAGQAVSELRNFEQELAKQVAEFDKIISQMNRYNSTGDLTDKIIKAQSKSGEVLTLEYANIAGQLVKTAQGLSKAGNSFGSFQQKVEKATNSQKDFTAAQAAVVAGLGKQFSLLPEDATQSSIEQLEREKNRLAKIVAGRRPKGGIDAAIQGALQLAETGNFSDKEGLIGNIERQVFNIVEARKRIDASSSKVQANLRAQAQAALAPLVTEADLVAKAKNEWKAFAAEVQRLDDAKDLRAILQGQLGFKQTRPNAPQFAGVEQSFNKLEKQVESGAISAERVLELFESIQKKRRVAFGEGGEEEAAFSSLKQLSTQQERYNAALTQAIAKRKQLQAARTERKASATLGTDATFIADVLKQNFAIDPLKLKSAQAGAFAKSLADIQAVVSAGQISLNRVDELYEQVQTRQNIVYAGPKDKTVVNSLFQLLSLQAKYRDELQKTAEQQEAQNKGTSVRELRLAQAQSLRNKLQAQLGFRQTRLETPQFVGVEQAFSAITERVLKGVSSERVQELFDSINNKLRIVTNNSDEKAVVAALKQISVAQKQYNTDLTKTLALRNKVRQAREAEDKANRTLQAAKADAADFADFIKSELSLDPKNLTQSQTTNFTKTIGSLKAAIASGASDSTKVLDLFRAIKTQADLTFAGPQDKAIVTDLQRLIDLERKVNEELSKQAQLRKDLQSKDEAEQKAIRAKNFAAIAAQDTTDFLKQSLNVDPKKIDTKQAAQFNRSLANIQATVASGGITSTRVSQLFDEIQAKQQSVFSGAKDKSVFNDLNALIRLQQSLSDAITNTTNKQAQQDALAKRNRVADKLETFTVNRLGGVGPDATAAQVQRIQSASTQLNAFLRTGKLANAQFKSVLAAFEQDANVYLTGLEGKLVKLFRNLKGAIDGVPTSLDRILSGFKSLGISWQGITAIFASQVIYGSMSRIISLLETSLRTASAFSIKIAEIRTLTEGNAISAGTWSRSLREVSDSFGIDLLDATAAAYDVLSNQVAKGTNAINFLKEAAIFSKITVSSLQDSVNLLSASVNAYRNQGLSATRASEILFSTIDLGKVRVDEIKDTFGNTAILAAQMGVSFEDLNAAFAAITIQGTRPDTAMTLLNNVMLKLLKPTGEMRKLMAEWGVSTGEQAIKTFQLTGILQKYNKAIEEGKIALEDANETRAIRGFAALGSDAGLAIVEENRRKQEQAAENRRRAEEIALNAPGALFQKQLVQFRNIITQDIATPMFEAFVKVTQAFGGIKEILLTFTAAFQGPISVVSKFLTVVGSLLGVLSKVPGGSSALSVLSSAFGGILTAFAAYKAQTLLVALANTNLGRSFLNVGRTILTAPGILGKFGAAVGLLRGNMRATALAADTLRLKVAALTFGIPFLIGALSSMSAKAEDTRLEIVRLSKESIDEANQRLFDAQTNGFTKYLEEVKKNNSQNNVQIRQANAALASSLNANVVEETENVRRQRRLLQQTGFEGQISFDFTVNGEEKDPKNALKEIGDGIKKSIDEAIKLETQISNLNFKNVLAGSDPFAQTDLVFDRIEGLQARVQELFSSRNMEGVRDTFKEINDLIKEQLVGREGLDGLIEKTRQELETLQIGDSPTKKKQAALEAETRGLDLLNLGNVRAANEEFAKADKYFSSLNTKGAQFDKTLRKLGVNVPESSASNLSQQERLQRRLEAAQRTKASDKNPETLIEDLARQQLDLENQFQRTQTQRLGQDAERARNLERQNEAVDGQEKAHERVGEVLRKNLETHNEILTVINQQNEAINLAIAKINPGTGSGLGLPGEIMRKQLFDSQFKPQELETLQAEITAQKAARDKASADFEKTQNATTAAALEAASAKHLNTLRTLSNALLERQKALSREQGVGSPETLKTDLEFDKLRQQLEIEKKQAEELQKLKADIDFNKTSSLNPSSIENFGVSSENVLGRMSEQLSFVTGQVRELNAALSSPTIRPTQLGRSDFATRINRVETPAQAGEPQGQAFVINGGLNVYVQEVVDNEIDPVAVSRALQRAARQGLIRST
jgi:hypothetical protein